MTCSVSAYSLDDKRSPIAANDIPDIIARFNNLDGEEGRERTEQSFFVTKEEIIDNGYDLSINKYKKTEYVAVEYIKTLSAIIGHVSSATTLDIYSHITTEMQESAARKIDEGYGREQSVQGGRKTVVSEDRIDRDWKPVDGKIRKSGTGCISQINDHLFEGRYTPTNAHGKRESHNVYAKTRADCEILLAAMIEDVRAKIAAEKERLQSGSKK